MRLALALRDLMVRTARHRLAWQAWRGAMLLCAHAVARWLAAGTGTTVWLRGSFGRGDAVPGLSDIDLVAATGADELGQALTHIRRRRLAESRAGLGRLVTVDLYEEGRIEEAAEVDELRFGLGRSAAPRELATRLRSRAPADELGLRRRPPLPSPWAGWRRLAGAASLRPVAEAEGADRLTAAWLELQYWWRHATRAAASPAGDLRSYMAVKLTAESARVRLWLAGEPWPATRVEALARLAELGPRERDLAEQALAIEAVLPAAGVRPLEPGLQALLLATADVAQRMATAAGSGTEVALAGAGGPLAAHGEGDLPLADWNARSVPQLPDEAFSLQPGHPGDPLGLARAERGKVRCVRDADVLVQAGSAVGSLRGVQCPATDPVSFAVLDGRDSAFFPGLPGWSARDCARRAVAEHRSWLAAQSDPMYVNERALGLLLTAARAALFLDSLDRGQGSLALTVAATAEALGEPELAQAPADPDVLEPLRAKVEEMYS